MKNFGRILRVAFRQRLSLVGVLATSLIVAMLWGLNISVLYPLVEVVFEGEGATTYIQREQKEVAAKIAEVHVEIAKLKQQHAATDQIEIQEALSRQIRWQQTQLELREKKADWLAWALPLAKEHLPTEPFQFLVMIIVFLMLGTVIKLIALTANLMVVQEVAERTSMDVRNMFFRHALKQDLDRFGDSGSSGLTARITNDVNILGTGLHILFGVTIREPLKMIVCIGGAAWVCPRLLLLVLVVTPILAILVTSLSKSIRRASRRVMEEMSQLYGVLNEAFTGIRVVRAYNTQGFERARFAQSARACYLKSMKAAWYHSLTRPTTELLGMAMISMAILGGGYLALNHKTHLLGIRMTYTELGFGDVLLFFAFLIGATDPARKLTNVWSTLQRGVAAADRIYEVIDHPIEIKNPEKPRYLKTRHQRIVFDQVNFSYCSGPQVLDGLDFQINQGETVAIVGPNGSGKSTIVNLLCRFYDPTSGSVRLDDIPIDEMLLRDVRKRIGLVTQRTFLFEDSIAANIRYGSPSATDEEVRRAAERAHADEFIIGKTPDGYETQLGSSGMKLSGGQMQRIALARAMLRDPEILILDEATSQIDLESEALIHDALGEFLQARTGIMVTHRPTTLQLADRIAVVEKGTITDYGDHATLLSRNEFYRNLVGSELKKAG